jgi:membrane associated rhomboid family serine protease
VVAGGSLRSINTTVCFRHTDRPTGRACTRCGKPACPDCLVAAAVGSHCVDCVKASRPPAAVRAQRWGRSAGNIVTFGLIGVNVLVFAIGTMIDRGEGLSGSGSTWGQFTDNIGMRHVDLLNNEWWRLLTSGFGHFGVLHLAMNMFGLWNLGRILEPVMSKFRYLLLYFACLLAGSFGVVLMEYAGYQKGSLTAGASGAIFGLLGAVAVAFQQRGVSLMKSGIGASLLINLFLTLQFGFSFGGHLGGFVGGLICGYFLTSTKRARAVSPIATYVPMIVMLVSFVGSVIVTRL